VRLYAFHRQGMFYPIQLKDDLDACRNAECNPGTIKVTEEPSGRVVWLHGKRVMKGGVGVVSASSRPAAAETIPTPDEIDGTALDLLCLIRPDVSRTALAQWLQAKDPARTSFFHIDQSEFRKIAAALSAPREIGERLSGGCRSTRHQRTGARSTSG
jgi:hypothetical protein